MRFEWNDEKNAINIKKHGIDFKDVEEMFTHPLVTYQDTRIAYGEERWVGIGWIKTSLCTMVYVEYYEDVIRIISVRKANKNEAKYYEQRI